MRLFRIKKNLMEDPLGSASLMKTCLMPQMASAQVIQAWFENLSVFFFFFFFFFLNVFCFLWQKIWLEKEGMRRFTREQ